MSPVDFLREEFENTERALHETLRHDYGPGRREEYYAECVRRLAAIKSQIAGLTNDNRAEVGSSAAELRHVAHAIALIERSHLGEFSWPFADELRDAAKSLLTEIQLDGERVSPIIHVVSEPAGYKIWTERQSPNLRSRFVTIHFPRRLKHHVLLHALFGHELGHAQIKIPDPDGLITSAARALSARGPMSSAQRLTEWIHERSAPAEIKRELQNYRDRHGKRFQFSPVAYKSWLAELLCDLFGLACFGPSFMAAHRVYLYKPFPYFFQLDSATHPAYACRQRTLVQALQYMTWNVPRTTPESGKCHEAEKIFIDFLQDDPYDDWAQLFDCQQISEALDAIVELFSKHDKLLYEPITAETLVGLIGQLSDGVPPVLAPINRHGNPKPRRINLGQILYAGWTHWIGRSALFRKINLTFFQTNRLCDQALIQQAAINWILRKRRLGA